MSRAPWALGLWPALVALVSTTGCGGGAPLLHPAHVLKPGDVTMGAGLSGQLAVRPLPPSASPASQNAASLQDLAIAPGVAPWVSGRFGIAGSNEAGLTYAGRSIRLDARHAFSLGKPTLSVGLGGSAIIARRPEGGQMDASGVYGGGFDVPVLIGLRSASDLYSIWFGPRAGMDFISGQLQAGDTIADVRARHFYGGLVAGFRAGFRHIHAAIEVNVSYHRADGAFKTLDTNIEQLSVTPAGAIEVSF